MWSPDMINWFNVLQGIMIGLPAGLLWEAHYHRKRRRIERTQDREAAERACQKRVVAARKCGYTDGLVDTACACTRPAVGPGH